MTELSTDRRFHSLTQEQIQTLDQVLTEVIPIHGRGNFPTLEVRPKDIIHMVRSKLTEKEIKVRDVRLNGSTASHVLVKENGTSYKDLDIIFGVELPKQEDFQIIKEVVLSCLLDFLPRGVNKDKITALTMKEAYVQKMVKVFTEHDRWSLISLSNNSGKNVELKFVNSLRRQFEFSVDSFQIILDRMLESYLEAERRQCPERKRPEDRASASQRTSQPLTTPVELPSTSLGLDKPQSLDQDLLDRTDDVSSLGDSPCSSEKVEMQEEPPHLTEELVAEIVGMDEVTEMEVVTETSTPDPDPEPVSQEEVDLVALEPAVKIPDSTEQVPELATLAPESDAQEPENVTESTVEVLETASQVAGPTAQVLKPVAQCEKLQMGATSHKQETEATALTRDLPTITVVAESMYGDFEQAMDHLRYRLIATRNPEEIRGGGLLKYSNLLVREFKPASETEIKTLERYMCSRFFIDFPDVNEQQRKIESYLRNHFIGEEKSKYDYLMTLRRVVNESTVCLMGHERRQTLNMITVLALKVLGEQNIIPNTTNVTCYYQPAPYMTDHSFNNYYMAHGQPPLFYQPYPLHIHMQTGLV
ncbi:hypothetical protein AAFF_G00046000 [Aldrovandia affinis]|uniref:polynucleotide adenylyltransferase n=1 Tax=Aldrovandia affinis TaxID=143900 RepID=A0AAD7S1S9_9TELE|nr:hypothetical protein AAFF_G00046000 [Aldrovandia affinis]